MARAKAIENSVKYTVVLPEHDVELLKDLVDNKAAVSVNAAIREAVEEYIVKTKKNLYKQSLIEAVNDPDFVNRTEESMEHFRKSDKEVEEMTEK